MKRILFLLLLSLVLGIEAQAQSMTDTQVMNFIKREVKAGTKKSQIVTKLVQKGVKMDQIRRVRDQYEEQIKD